MKKRGRQQSKAGFARRVRQGLSAILIGGLASACSELLDVEAPSRIDAESLEDAGAARLLVESASSDFECALAEYIVGAGLVGDEFQDAQLASAMWPYDQRQWNPETGGVYATATCNSGALGIYTTLSTARWQADNALTLLDGWTDSEVEDRTSLIATAAAYSGYSHLIMGEGMCSAAFDLGPELSRAEIFTRAEDRFTRAIETARGLGDDEIENMALVGRARTRVNLNRMTDAATDAELVPVDFVKNATFSATDPRRENDIWTRNIRGGSITIEDDFHDLTWQGVADPRVTVTYAGISTGDNITELWQQDKYSSVSSSIPIATWDEALPKRGGDRMLWTSSMCSTAVLAYRTLRALILTRSWIT
jgi:hypothetical protein